MREAVVASGTWFGWAMALLVPSQGGCLDAREGHSSPPDAVDSAQDTRPEETRTAADTTPPQETGEVSVAPTVAVCAPSAVAFEFSVPAIPTEVADREDCPLASVTTETSASNDYVSRTDYVWAGDTLTITQPSSVVRYAFAPDGELARFERSYAFAAATDVIEFLPGGRVASVWHGPVGGALEELVHQEWSADGRLVARTETFAAQGSEAPFGPRAQVVTTWEYDARGRLAGARTAFGPHVADASWTYDASGVPTRVVRTRDGVVVEDQRWTWDAGDAEDGGDAAGAVGAAGALAKREITRDVSGDAFGPGYAYTSYFLGGPRIAPLDDAELGAAVAREWRENPWNSAPAVDGARACRPLPTGFGHGYPATDARYDLGWARAERPHGIGFAYGSSVYAYDYGDLGWFGHEGADGGQGSLSVDLVNQGAGHAIVSYENGEMVRQVVTSSAWDLGSFEATRERVFEARAGQVGAGLLVSDQVSWTVAGTGQTGERELTFRYGDDGRLVKRELLDATRGLLAFQTWTWDAAGHVTAHAIAGGDSPNLMARPTTDDAPAVSHRYERTFDDDARLVRDAEIVVSKDGREAASELVRTFEGTRLVRVTGPREDTTYTYDAAGRLSEEVHRFSYAQVPPVEAVQRVTYAYDADGRLVRTEDRLSGEYPRNVIETRAYACGAP